MTVTTEQEISAAAGWLRAESARLPFGELAIRLVLHDGQVVRTERSITAKLPVAGSEYARAR